MAAASSLVAGALMGLARPIPKLVVASVMAFGAGTLISAVSFELTEEAFARAGADAVALGLGLGGITFFSLNRLISGGEPARGRKRSKGSSGTATQLALGAAIDAVPESALIGLTLVEGGGVGAALVIAVFISNVPESLAAASGMRQSGHSRRWILGLWSGVVLLSGACAALGYGLLGDASDNLVGTVQAFGAGALLTMLADTMMPEAFEESERNPAIGLLTVLGFAVAFLLSTLG
jgi:ZIP family zinc transporter